MPQKIAFITGANRGLGFQTALDFKAHDVHSVITARDKAQGEAALAKLLDAGVSASLFVFDITSPADHQRAFDFLAEKFGRLDILVNNAGVAAGGFPPVGPEHTTTADSAILHRVFETNFFAPIALTRTLLPLLRKAPAARIVNLSSILGSLALHADPASPIYNAKSFAYDASKSALNAFTIHLAYELRSTPIKVNSAHPGWVQTDMGGSEAPMQIQDGARTTVALATLGADGPSGGFFHMGDPLPW